MVGARLSPRPASQAPPGRWQMRTCLPSDRPGANWLFTSGRCLLAARAPLPVALLHPVAGPRRVV